MLNRLSPPPKQKHFYGQRVLLVVTSSVFLLSGCLQTTETSIKASAPTEQSVEVKAAMTSASSESNTVLAQHLDAPSMYQILVGEMMVQKGYDQQAFDVIYDLAQKRRDPILAERAFQLSMKTFNTQKVEAATQLWRQVSPQSTVAWRASYLISLRKGDIEQAIEQWQYFQKISEEPLSEDFILTAQRVVASIPVQTGLEFFKKLSEIHSNNWHAYLALALASEAYNKIPEALEAAEKARSLQFEEDDITKEASLYQLLAKLYIQTKPPERGLTSLIPYITRNPSDWLVQERMARLEVQAEMYEAASERYKYILKSVPDAHNSRLSLALIQIEYKANDEAKQNLLKMVEQQGYVDVASYYLGLIYQGEENSQKALVYFGRVQSDNYYVDAQLHSAEIYFSLKEVTKALSILDNLKGKEPSDRIKIYRAKGVFYTLEDKFELALEQYDKALELDPSNTQFLMSQALIFYNTKQYGRYEEALKRVIEIKPNEVDALNALGYYYVDTDQHMNQAEEMLNKAYNLAPDSYYVLDSLGWLYYQQGKYHLAEEFLAKALAIQVDDEVLIHMISTYWKLDQKVKAKKLWRDNQENFLKNKELQGLIKQLELE
ncbi:MAG: hypothetical protein ISEC1_P0872 [Thiomicrorhabdus sp.]|nr:MAG: hypothetical protein ISEC1_P0872 [Thiomicrorhabdus sp.]